MTFRQNSKTIFAALALVAPMLTTPVYAHDNKLPLGDGQVSSSAQSDNVYSCQQRFNPNAPGAQASGDWIVGDNWYPELKPTVDGDVMWAGGGVQVSLSGNTRVIISDLLPTHATGVYPVQRSDDAVNYDRNPNSIKAQNFSLELPAQPEVASSVSCVPMGMIGISLSGAAIFNALDARGDDAPAHEIQDDCGGHPEREGMYHYHNASSCMVSQAETSDGHSGLVGYALDGFGIYGVEGANAKHLSNDDLDACHGHTETVVWDDTEQDIYHYHLTDEYPYTIGCFVGTPVK
ncbi:YHYH protein [Maritalea sp.]|uniref:YHYH protein n=1 Tax=Maritalea sp. TaxID=2003361 RepID=UPI0039E31752